MNNFYFENKNSGNFLIFNPQREDELDAFTLGMLSNNTIPGLLSVGFVQMNNERQFMYNVTAKVSLKQYMSGRITKGRCIDVFRGIACTALSCSEFMLDSSSIIFDPDYIFVDVSTNELSMVCLPTVREKQISDLESYFRQLLSGMLFSEEENMEYPAKILNILNGKESPTDTPKGRFRSRGREEAYSHEQGFSLERFIKQLEALSDEKTESASVAGAEAQQFKQPQESLQLKDSQQSQQPRQSKKSRKSRKSHQPQQSKIEAEPELGWDSKLLDLGLSNFDELDFGTSIELGGERNHLGQKQGIMGFFRRIVERRETKNEPEGAEDTDDFYLKLGRDELNRSYDFGETTFLGGEQFNEGTMLLSEQEFLEHGGNMAYLLRKKTDESIEILGDTFKIGKEKQYVDYHIESNPTVSRSHADIIRKENSYYIIDNNSTNHTYLDGEVIPNCKEILLKDGCEIVLGNEEFSFHCRW